MARYGKIVRTFWTNPKVRRLRNSKNPLDADKLLAYLYSNDHLSIIGLYRLDPLYICADLDVTVEKLRAPFDKLVAAGFIYYDPDTSLVLINDWFEHNQIQNANQCKSAEREIDNTPQTPLLRELERLLEPLPEPFAKRLGERLHKRFRIQQQQQQQEQEPEQQQEQEQDTPPAKPAADARTRLKLQYEELRNLFNLNCPSLNSIQKITPRTKRGGMVAARLKSDSNMDFWAGFFRSVEASDFLTGRGGRDWVATFDWIMNLNNFQKIVEGNYVNDRGTGQAVTDAAQRIREKHGR
jgi:hypothetical protein